MPEGTYNLLTKTGTIVEDPSMVVEIEGFGEWGLGRSGVGVETAVGYVLMREADVTLAEKDAWYAKNGHPEVTVHHDDGPTIRYEWDDDVDDYVTVSKSMEANDD